MNKTIFVLLFVAMAVIGTASAEEISGFVLNPEGYPIAGVEVEFYNTDNFSNISIDNPEIITTTNYFGQYTINSETAFIGIMYIPNQNIGTDIEIIPGHAWINSDTGLNYPSAHIVVQIQEVETPPVYNPIELKTASQAYLDDEITMGAFLDAIARYFVYVL